MYLLLRSKEAVMSVAAVMDAWILGLVQTCVLNPVCCALGSELPWSPLVMPQGSPAASEQVWWAPVAVWMPLPAVFSSAAQFFQGSQTPLSTGVMYSSRN